MDNQETKASTKKLSGRTVGIVFGIVGLTLTIIWWIVGGWYMALTVPVGILAFLVIMVFFRALYDFVLFPIISFVVIGVVRMARLMHATIGKKR